MRVSVCLLVVMAACDGSSEKSTHDLSAASDLAGADLATALDCSMLQACLGTCDKNNFTPCATACVDMTSSTGISQMKAIFTCAATACTMDIDGGPPCTSAEAATIEDLTQDAVTLSAACRNCATASTMSGGACVAEVLACK
jgi:hypothetical protein